MYKDLRHTGDEVDNAVDKEDDKGLSTNDYTYANIPTLATKNEVAQVRMAVGMAANTTGVSMSSANGIFIGCEATKL